MELGRFRDLSRIYLLVAGAFSVVFFVRWVMIGYITGGAFLAAICGAALFIFLLVGVYLLYFGLERWDRFYSDLTVPRPAQPYQAYYQPAYYQPAYYQAPAYYYAQPAYYHPPPPQPYGMPAQYPYPQYPPPAHRPPAYQQAGPGHQPPPAYRQPGSYGQPPQQQGQPGQGQPYQQPGQYRPPPPPQYAQPYPWPPQVVPAYPQPRPFPDYAGPRRYLPKAPQPPRELDPRRALILPDAMRLLLVFLSAVFVGGLALAAAPYTAYITLLVFLPAFVIGFSFPSLIWISYVYSFETTHLLPSKKVLTAFVYGMLSTIPALLVNTLAAAWLGEGEGASLAVTLVVAAVVAPFVEEFVKPWGVLLVSEEVRGRLDGLIFGITCGVGFALIENITYEFSFVLTGESAAAVWTLGSLARGLGSIMVHAAGAGMIGYAYGAHRSGGGLSGVPLAYIAAVAMHAAWNGSSSVFATVDWGIYATVGFMVLFVAITFLLIRNLIERGAASERRPATTPPPGPPGPGIP